LDAYKDYGIQFLSKLTIGNLLDVIKYKISGLNTLPAAHRLITKKNYCTKGETGEGTEWLTAGITYLLPKSGDSK